MDPLSHLLFGRVLIGLDERKWLGPGALGACVLGSILPDSDVVLMPVAWDIYLRAHVAGTHSLVGSAICAAAAAGVVRLARPAGRFRPLFVAAWAGSLGHLFWDVVSGGSARLGWPLIDALVSAPLVAMADPFVLALLVVAGLAMRLRPQHLTRIAAATVVILAGLLCAKLVLRHHAVTAYGTETRGDQVIASVIEARWSYLREWDIFDRTAHALRAWRIDAAGRVRLRFAHAIDPEVELAEQSRALGTVQNFLRVHTYGFPVEQHASNGLQRVLWSDIRYCWPRRAETADRTPEPNASAAEGWPPPTTSGSNGIPIACGIWFGGTFDRDGRALAQIVQIADVVQSRR